MRQLVLVRCDRNGEAHETKKRSQNSGTADLHGRNVIITVLLDYKALTQGCTDHFIYLLLIYVSKRAVKRLCECTLFMHRVTAANSGRLFNHSLPAL